MPMKRPAAPSGDSAGEERRPLERGERLRERAAWMYYVEEMTQSEIAQVMGVGRVTVARMLAQARALGEVRVALKRGLSEFAGLEIALAKALDAPEAIVAPLSSPEADPTGPIGAALGTFVSGLIADDMRIGLGWGRTLFHSLGYLSERAVRNVTVVSLVGGVTHVARVNPAEYAWEFARVYKADCYLIAAPALVDSPATRQALIERCGLKKVYDFARRLDAVVISVGALGAQSTIARFGLIDESERRKLGEYGAVGEMLCNVFTAEGRLIDHPVNARVMSFRWKPSSPLRSACLPPGVRPRSRRCAARPDCCARPSW